MRRTPTAIGYLRKDVSGVHQQWDETRIRSHAKRLGYDLAKTVTFSNATDDPESRLVNVVRSLDIDAVIAPSLAHFGGAVPETLVRSCELNVLAPQPATYSRRFDEIRERVNTAAGTPFPAAPPASTSDAEAIRANDWAAFRAVSELGDHWTLKRWSPGQSGYYWYLTFDDPALTELAARCQKTLADGTIDPVPLDGLHLTVLGVGRTGEVPSALLPGLLETARTRLATTEPFDLGIGPLTGSRSALRFSVTPWDDLLEVHRQLREASAPLGGRRTATPDFRPHLAVAYVNTTRPAADLIEEVAALRELPPVTVRVRAVELVEVRRDGRRYRWNDIGSVPLDE